MNDWDLWDVAQSKSVERSREIDLIFERLIDFRDIEFVFREIEYGFKKYSTTNMLLRIIYTILTLIEMTSIDFERWKVYLF